ncbi:MAG: tRNA (adenosine(37)-N6)-threonylcarbamoyltransferase complex dimerization subunit type 1 TsaB [Clostridia bacterium]|nr:tRNA (adenosine(37)-N6)-threonylcarbamoyltransferase complex dimerization subunit type 1 TsaB [Clostridia bacterium]
MKILSCECSAKSASCAISEDGKIIADAFINLPLTHSQTLLPMISSMLSSSKTDIKDIDAFAVSAGPGSFTGIRIGISAIKGMALSKNAPCIPVSTLEAIAYGFTGSDALICAVMDARCNQLYSGIFRVKNGRVKRISEDEAVSISLLAEKINKSRVKCPIIIAGDGATVFYPHVKNKNNLYLADEICRYQRASGVALCATEKYNKGETVSAERLLPVYLRLPQAERELKLKKEKETK